MQDSLILEYCFLNLFPAPVSTKFLCSFPDLTIVNYLHSAKSPLNSCESLMLVSRNFIFEHFVSHYRRCMSLGQQRLIEDLQQKKKTVKDF